MPKDELTSNFLLAEFSAVQDRIKSYEEIKSQRVNFFLLIVGAVAAGIMTGLQAEIVQSNLLAIALISSVIISFIGIMSLYHQVITSVSIVTLYHRSGRIRKWFYDNDEDILPYLVFEPADDKPRLVFIIIKAE